jgi:predicted metal-dependent phosphotriesterase family hydrolase
MAAEVEAMAVPRPTGWPRRFTVVLFFFTCALILYYADRLLLCAEVAMKTCYTHYGGWGYAHVSDNSIPWLKSLGAADTAIAQMLVDSPRRLHAVG